MQDESRPRGWLLRLAPRSSALARLAADHSFAPNRSQVAIQLPVIHSLFIESRLIVGATTGVLRARVPKVRTGISPRAFDVLYEIGIERTSGGDSAGAIVQFQNVLLADAGPGRHASRSAHARGRRRRCRKRAAYPVSARACWSFVGTGILNGMKASEMVSLKAKIREPMKPRLMLTKGILG